MKRRLAITVAASLLPFVACCDEMPLWEIRARLDGGKNIRFHELFKSIISEQSPGLIGDQAVVRFAGFDNPETPGEDWVAEVDGVADIGQIIDKLSAETKADEKGRFHFSEGNSDFAVWRDGTDRIRMASPALNMEAKVTSMTSLTDDAWLAGWIDLKKISQHGIESKTLKLPETLQFSASSGSQGNTLEFRAKLESQESVEPAKLILNEIQKELGAAEKTSATKVPKIEIGTDGSTLMAKVRFSDADLDEWIKEVQAALVPAPTK